MLCTLDETPILSFEIDAHGFFLLFTLENVNQAHVPHSFPHKYASPLISGAWLIFERLGTFREKFVESSNANLGGRGHGYKGLGKMLSSLINFWSIFVHTVNNLADSNMQHSSITVGIPQYDHSKASSSPTGFAMPPLPTPSLPPTQHTPSNEGRDGKIVSPQNNQDSWNIGNSVQVPRPTPSPPKTAFMIFSFNKTRTTNDKVCNRYLRLVAS